MDKDFDNVLYDPDNLYDTESEQDGSLKVDHKIITKEKIQLWYLFAKFFCIIFFNNQDLISPKLIQVILLIGAFTALFASALAKKREHRCQCKK